MAIASAVLTSSMLRVYNERGVQIFNISGVAELVGYTSTTVSVKLRGDKQTRTYDEKGRFKFKK